jgi:hypothetical protein
MNTRLLPRMLVFACGCLAAAAALPCPAASGDVRGFLKANCMSCHDDASAEARLSVESLGDDFADPRWVRIHDRVQAGEMPPADEEQPRPADRKAFTAALGKSVAAALEARHAAEGRVMLRRMNRREHEHALHDLLGVGLPLTPLLPEDRIVDGFDTVTEGLEISAPHLLAYQRVADAALAAALPPYPLEVRTILRTGKQWYDAVLPVHRKLVDPFVRVDGDAVVLHYSSLDNTVRSPDPPVPGVYRIRAAVRPVNPPGRTQTVLISASKERFQAHDYAHIFSYHDVPAGKTTVIETTAALNYPNPVGGGTLFRFANLQPQGLPKADMQAAKSKAGLPPPAADFAGPGLAVEWVELHGPLDEGLGYRRIFGDLPREPQGLAGQKSPKNWQSWKPGQGEFKKFPLGAVSTSPKADAERLIRGFLPLAFRGPVPDPLAARYVRVAHAALDAGNSFDESVRAAAKAILCAPQFLHYIEPAGRLDDHAVAARLARFLWSSVPDEPLLAAAAAGRLSTPAGLRAETERMLADPKAARFVRGFTDNWLDLRDAFAMKPDLLYVEADDHLLWSMPEETRAFFARVLAEDLPAASFFDSDWAMLNGRLAAHYGIEGVEGAEFRRVALEPEHHRGGVITQASFLKMSTNASYTSPVKRGAWVLERILGTPPNPPPPNIKAVEPDIRGATTIREQLALHKNQESCAACHRVIDPPGYALENYDVIGGWREKYRVKSGASGTERISVTSASGRPVNVFLAKQVEPSGETAAGEKFRDIAEYKRLVLRDRDQLGRAMVHKLVAYATGAPVDFADRAAVERILADTKARDHGLRSLVHAVVQSPMFLNK